MGQQIKSSTWHKNPFAAVFEVARANDISTSGLESALTRAIFTADVQADDLVAALLVEVERTTHITIQRQIGGARYRAVLNRH